MTHTKGPWVLDGDDIRSEVDGEVVGSPVGDTPEQAQANGLMQAAAPELFDALSPFARIASMFDFSVGPDGIDDGLTVVVKTVARPEVEATLSTADFHTARAVILKAQQGGE